MIEVTFFLFFAWMQIIMLRYFEYGLHDFLDLQRVLNNSQLLLFKLILRQQFVNMCAFNKLLDSILLGCNLLLITLTNVFLALFSTTSRKHSSGSPLTIPQNNIQTCKARIFPLLHILCILEFHLSDKFSGTPVESLASIKLK